MADWFVQGTAPVHTVWGDRARERQLSLTKPPGSLGRLEEHAIALSAMQGRIDPAVDHVRIAIFAGDHGVAHEGVSAFPQAVTTEMVRNFVRGGAAISVLAKKLGAGLSVVNAGTIHREGFGEAVIDQPIARGCGNIAVEPAMSREQCVQALSLGQSIVEGYGRNCELVIGGEMGIANTTSATALAVAMEVGDPQSLAGPGTGLDEAGMKHKIAVIEKAVSRQSTRKQAVDILADLGGFEIAALTGYYIAAAQRGIAILVDGFIASVAALAASRINPGTRNWLLFSHTSAEPGHQMVLEALHAEPLLCLEMRLGEGSGAAVAVDLLRSACALQNGMATFAEAGVSSG